MAKKVADLKAANKTGWIIKEQQIMSTDRYVDLLKQGFMKPRKQATNIPNRFVFCSDISGEISYAQSLCEARQLLRQFMKLPHVKEQYSSYRCLYVRDRAKDNNTVIMWERANSDERWVKTRG